MTTNLNFLVEIDVSQQGLAVDRISFTDVLGLFPSVAFTGGDIVRAYRSQDDVDADPELGAVAIDALTKAFAMSNAPDRVLVAEKPTEIAEEWLLGLYDPAIGVDDDFTTGWPDTVDPTSGQIFTVSIGGVEAASFEATGGETLADMFASLKSQLEAHGDVASATSLIGDGIAALEVVAELGESLALTVSTNTFSELFPPLYAVQSVEAVTIADFINQIRAVNDSWFGLYVYNTTRSEAGSLALWADANGEKAYFVDVLDAASLNPGSTDNLALDLELYKQTVGAAHDEQTDYLAFLLATNRLSINPDVKATQWSWVDLSPATVSSFSNTERDTALERNLNVFGRVRGLPVTAKGRTTAGVPVEALVAALWSQARIREAVVQLMYDTVQRGDQLPYDDIGIARIESQAANILARGENIGHFINGSTRTNFPALADVPAADITAGILRGSWGGRVRVGIVEVNLQGVVTINFTPSDIGLEE